MNEGRKYNIFPSARYKRTRKLAKKRGLDMDMLDWTIDRLGPVPTTGIGRILRRFFASRGGSDEACQEASNEEPTKNGGKSTKRRAIHAVGTGPSKRHTITSKLERPPTERQYETLP